MASGLKHHKSSFHNYSFHKLGLPMDSQSGSPHEGIIHDYHDKLTGQKCDANRQHVHLNSPPPVSENCPDDWGPYDHKELYETIDATKLGDVWWDTFKLRYNGEWPIDNIPAWMDEMYEYWFQDPSTLIENMLLNTEFDG
ncbi:hypothetical protein EDC04DRAFT_2897221 [Pisolithus marmoratus]|nr:hypothetical protein EDC04DRAFT_2897221 [Pisolithus marmoratus]